MYKLIKTSLITAALTLGFNPLYAGGNHDHGHSHSHDKEVVSEQYAKNMARQEIRALILSDKIDKSWAEQKVVSVEKKKFDNIYEWVFKYENKGVKDTEKQTLYVFVNEFGEPNGANYSGN